MTKIQEILEIGLEDYLEKHKIVGYKQKVIKAIKNCKSEKLGSHKYVCDECGYEEIAYNSCRNRHCPNCQTGKKLKWIEARKEEVSRKFRGKFLSHMKETKLDFYGKNKE